MQEDFQIKEHLRARSVVGIAIAKFTSNATILEVFEGKTNYLGGEAITDRTTFPLQYLCLPLIEHSFVAKHQECSGEISILGMHKKEGVYPFSELVRPSTTAIRENWAGHHQEIGVLQHMRLADYAKWNFHSSISELVASEFSSNFSMCSWSEVLLTQATRTQGHVVAGDAEHPRIIQSPVVCCTVHAPEDRLVATAKKIAGKMVLHEELNKDLSLFGSPSRVAHIRTRLTGFGISIRYDNAFCGGVCWMSLPDYVRHLQHLLDIESSQPCCENKRETCPWPPRRFFGDGWILTGIGEEVALVAIDTLEGWTHIAVLCPESGVGMALLSNSVMVGVKLDHLVASVLGKQLRFFPELVEPEAYIQGEGGYERIPSYSVPLSGKTCDYRALSGRYEIAHETTRNYPPASLILRGGIGSLTLQAFGHVGDFPCLEHRQYVFESPYGALDFREGKHAHPMFFSLGIEVKYYKRDSEGSDSRNREEL